MAQVDWFPKVQGEPKCALCITEHIRDTSNPYKIRNFNQAQRFLKHHFPSPTLTKSEVIGSDLPFAGKERIGDKRAAIIGSFPNQFVFDGNWKDAIAQIANSVPPLFMFAIAGRIRELFFDGKKQAMSTNSNYLEILDQAWQQHLAPREPAAPTLISTFAGCGGSSLGYSMAGFRELLAVEWDNNAVETFKLNFPGVPVYHGDIAKLTVEQCLEMTGLQPGELDLLDGSPPCQGFSTAGKRKMDDDRNQLFREFVRLLRGLKPKVFVMENVSGLVKGKMKLIFAEIMRELKASGYQVRCKLLNAMYFNVPQSRQRLIFIGVRDDLGIGVSFPGAQGNVIKSGIAINGVDGKPLGKPTLTVRKIAHRIKPGENAGKYTPNGTAFSVSRLDTENPSMTITKHLAGTSGILQPRGYHYLSEGQLKRIGSYPDSFIMTGKPIERWACIGNSVPPLMMKSIAEYIKKSVLLP